MNTKIILRVAVRVDPVAFQTWYTRGVRVKDAKISKAQELQQFKAICAAADIVDSLVNVSKSEMNDALSELLDSEMFTENDGAHKKWLTYLS